MASESQPDNLRDVNNPASGENPTLVLGVVFFLFFLKRQKVRVIDKVKIIPHNTDLFQIIKRALNVTTALLQS